MMNEIPGELTQRYKQPNTNNSIPLDSWNNIQTEITDRDNQILCKEVRNKEIKEAVFQLALDKTLGPDGFPIAFFRLVGPLWEIRSAWQLESSSTRGTFLQK